MGMTRRGVSARGGVAMSRSGAETSACSASLTSGFVSTSGWAGLSADAEVEKTKVNKQRTGAARVIWLACMLSPLEARPRVAPSPSSFWFRIKARRMEALQGLNCPAFKCLKIREHLFYVAEVEASGRSATVSSTVGFHCHAPHRARG